MVLSLSFSLSVTPHMHIYSHTHMLHPTGSVFFHMMNSQLNLNIEAVSKTEAVLCIEIFISIQKYLFL